MNPHPILVHFPIALLTVYSLMELVRIKKVSQQAYWFYAKALFVMIGGLGALAALYTGDFAVAAARSGEVSLAITNFREVVSMHENFADASVAIYGIIAAGYLVLWFNRERFGEWLKPEVLKKIWVILVKVFGFVIETRFVVLLALAGLVAVTITGALGGAMVYGPNVDPVVRLIYSMFF
ncbi:MAG: hypothetical protein HY918_03590 [Candidatus Doudnabacteria bacterium]|nr:hypothetical protein [Candidatus Doudnabacteria bacterium]